MTTTTTTTTLAQEDAPIERKLDMQTKESQYSLTAMQSACERLGQNCDQLLHQHTKGGDGEEEVQKLLQEGMDVLLDLKVSHRHVSQNERRIRDIARAYYGRSSALELKLQNMNFEAHNLHHQIEQCRQFVSRHEGIELCPVEEFYQNAPQDLLKDLPRTNDVEMEEKDAAMRDGDDDGTVEDGGVGVKKHEFTMKRLQFELEERKRLLKEIEHANVEKRKINEDNNKREKFLSGLHDNVRAIRDASKPLQQYMEMDYYSNHTLNDLARQLPTPLYVLFNSIVFYRDNFDNKISLQIEGDLGRTRSYWEKFDAEKEDEEDITTSEQEQQELEQEQEKRQQEEQRNQEETEKECKEDDDQHPPAKRARVEDIDEDDIFMDDALQEIETEEQQQSSDKLKTVVQTPVQQLTKQQINKLLEDFPLSLKIGIPVPFSDKDKKVTLIFSYLPRANLILVREQNFRVLHRLFPDDTGTFSPNTQILADYNFSDSPLGKPYKWAQWVAGLDFLEPVTHDTISRRKKVQPSKKNNIPTIIELVKYKIRAARHLNRQLRYLEEKRILPEPVLNSSRAGFSPGHHVKLESFEQTQQGASTRKKTFVCVISREEVQLEAKIDLPWMDYPVTTPQFHLKFKKGQPEMNWNIPEHLESLVTDKTALDARKRSASYDTSLRDIENEVNINTPLHLHLEPTMRTGSTAPSAEDEAPFYLLSFQLARLMVCIDIFFSNDQNKIAAFLEESRNETGQEQIARKHVGRSLLSPLRFNK